jgi:hypothetical protein
MLAIRFVVQRPFPENVDPSHAMGTAGNEVWSNGEWSETGQGGTGEAIQIKGYWSAIDIREGDAFKIRMMTYNLTPAPAK